MKRLLLPVLSYALLLLALYGWRISAGAPQPAPALSGIGKPAATLPGAVSATPQPFRRNLPVQGLRLTF